VIATDVVKLCYTAYSRCRRVLFTTNGGNNSVSSFSVGEDGRLTLLDLKPTGKPVEGRSGTAKSLANSPSRRMLFVVHAFGPDHLRLMSIDREGELTAPRSQHARRSLAMTPSERSTEP